MNKKFKFLLYIATVILIITIIIFYPDYNNGIFPLFSDITTFFIFLPAYFLFFWGVLPLFILLYGGV